MQNTMIFAAQAAGHYSAAGRIKKGAGDTINIPEGMINIGGNSHGYIMNAQTDLNPVLAENRDASFTALALGDDIFIYAVQQSSGIAKIVFSKNSTYPDTYSAVNSRKIGGFHVGKSRPMSQKYNPSFTCPTGILHNAVWCLNHGPNCDDPTGMAEFAPGHWAMIYEASIKSGSGMDAVLQSKFNATPVTGTEGYNYSDLSILLQRAGLLPPNYWQFRAMAYGVPPGTTGQTGRINTGAETGYGFNPISCANISQPSGNIYMIGAELYDAGITSNATWNDTLNTGEDALENIGEWYGHNMRTALYGADWSNAGKSGAGALNLNGGPWYVHTNVGPRGVCDSRKR